MSESQTIGHIDHVGVYVGNLDATVEFLGVTFGLTVSRTIERPDRLRAAFLTWGPIKIELIELVDAETREGRTEGRRALLDHIAVRVDDLDAAILAVGDHGVQPLTAEPVTTSDGGRTVFFDPATAMDIRFQLFESP